MPLVSRYLKPRTAVERALNLCAFRLCGPGNWFGAFNPLEGAPARLPAALATLVILLLAGLNAPAAGVRVRDLAVVAGARDNQLVGYGLVAGLAGDGDKDPVYTKQTIANLLQRYGINVPAT